MPVKLKVISLNLVFKFYCFNTLKLAVLSPDII